HREIVVLRIRIHDAVFKRRLPRADWQVIVHGYSRALTETGRPPAADEDAWEHLDRIYGVNRWLPAESREEMRESYETNVSIADLEELGNIWLFWFVRADNLAVLVRDLGRSNARQLRV